MSEREKIIDKVRKLIALQTSPNQHEAMAAAEKAQALILEYNLTHTELRDTQSEYFAIQIQSDAQAWRRPIAHHLAKMYLCLYFVTRMRDDDVHNFFGSEASVVTAELMFQYIVDTIEREANEGVRWIPVMRRSSYLESFKNAAAVQIIRKIMARIERAEAGHVQTAEGTTLPAVIGAENFQKQLQNILEEATGGKMGSKPEHLEGTDERGLIDGYVTGKKIGLDTQIDNRDLPRISS